MKKHLSIPMLPSLVMVFLLTGCEKDKPVADEKKRAETSVIQVEAPPSDTLAEKEAIEEPEIIEDKEKRVATGEPPATDNKKFEGSQSLKRYIDESP